MIVRVLSCGIHWWSMYSGPIDDPFRFRRKAAFFNSTGLMNGRRRRDCYIYPGRIRFNRTSGFDPEAIDRISGKTYQVSGPTLRAGEIHLLFQLPAVGRTPDAYLVTLHSATHGPIDFSNQQWRAIGVQPIAISSSRDRYQAMLLLRPDQWVRTGLAVGSLAVMEQERLCKGGMKQMRYEKGMIAINKDRDVPILLLIRNAKVIRLSQLYENLALVGLEPNRRTAYWRVRRLVTAKLLKCFEELPFIGESAYGITRDGLALLESHGHCLISLGSFTRTLFHQSDAIHMVELNDFRIALMRAGLLVSWKGELEVLSENLALYGEGVKDYDALVTVKVGDVNVRFALEYERTAKSTARYREIRKAIEQDHRVDLVLYLTPSQELMYLLTREFSGSRKRISFGISNHFKTSTLAATVFTRAAGANDALSRYQPFIEALRELVQEGDPSLA